ncbi:MAG: hypothetical protein ABW167_09565 [Baekduia sp.]
MAANDPKTKPTPKPVQHPVYDVVRVTRAEGHKAGEHLQPGDTLTVIDFDVRDKTALDAADQAVKALPAAERNGEFGAFLSRSWKADEWTTEETVITSRKSQK